MQTEEILSAGIDIGTSTTQLVFSRMILQNTGGFGRIPQIKVVSKEVIYESEIYFTPLSSREEIDGERVHEIIKKEYEKAGVCPADLATGAVIITGGDFPEKKCRVGSTGDCRRGGRVCRGDSGSGSGVCFGRKRCGSRRFVPKDGEAGSQSGYRRRHDKYLCL